MTSTLSLRMRLTMIILVPLLGVCALIGAWAFLDAQGRAGDRFDRSLLSAVLAISRDVAVSGGDALSAETNALLRDTSGGQVFYHVYAPDGVFVTGYATPPVPPAALLPDDARQVHFDAAYLGQPVRVLRFVDAMQIEGLAGDFTFTVWQNTRLRDAIVRDSSTRTFSIMASLVATLALIVWFGVRFGLSPLTDLQSAIAARSSDDLRPIRRGVPEEVRGIVGTLNALLGQVASTMRAKDDFISNAAHQLRNPIAGVLTMSEALDSAKTVEDFQERSGELVLAARQASDLANKLLAFERAQAMTPGSEYESNDLAALVGRIVDGHRPKMTARNVNLTFSPAARPIMASCDPLMFGEAVTNLLDNALLHGGEDLRHIDVELGTASGQVTLVVRDDGKGIAETDIELALSKFGQIEPTGGSGLGLTIAQTVAEKHGGKLTLGTEDTGLSVSLTVPL